jgi:hypothetical protein
MANEATPQSFSTTGGKRPPQNLTRIAGDGKLSDGGTLVRADRHSPIVECSSAENAREQMQAWKASHGA